MLASLDSCTDDIYADREVKKANRELQSQLSAMDPSINKIDTIQRKYSELLAEMKKTEREHIKSKKRGDQLQKEKDSQRSELTKANAVKDKLEKLSRELTRENKKLKEDFRDVKETATDKNEELHRRLEQMVDDVEEVVGDRRTPERSLEEMEQDKMYVPGRDITVMQLTFSCRFREKFKSMVEQYEMREIHFHSVLRTRELEIQYHIAQHEKLRKAQDAELSKSHQLTRQVSTFSQTENELRSQLNIYVEKFKQVSNIRSKPNQCGTILSSICTKRTHVECLALCCPTHSLTQSRLKILSTIVTISS